MNSDRGTPHECGCRHTRWWLSSVVVVANVGSAYVGKKPISISRKACSMDSDLGTPHECGCRHTRWWSSLVVVVANAGSAYVA